MTTNAPAAPNRFHNLIRLQRVSAFEAITLVGVRSVLIENLTQAMNVGRKLLDSIPEVSGEFLLKGVTGIARRDWGSALSNLWVVIEQITSHLWSARIIGDARSKKSIAGRMDQLSDTRTWTVATRHELLYHIGVIPIDSLELLSTARKARNALAHRGTHPNESEAQSAYNSALALFSIATNDFDIPLQKLDLQNHVLSDPFKPQKPRRLNPMCWMEIPKLPGESELEKLEADRRSGQIRDKNSMKPRGQNQGVRH